MQKRSTVTHEQFALFEPTGEEVHRLAMYHAQQAEKAMRTAELAHARGFEAVAESYMRLSMQHTDTSSELAMLAEFERLGGVA